MEYSENKIEELCFYIKKHSTDIDLSKVNNTNYKRYAKLLTIQYCDCSAYNPIYVRKGMDKLDRIKNSLLDYTKTSSLIFQKNNDKNTKKEREINGHDR